MQFNSSHYSLPIFAEMGYERKKCKSCGEYFWTLEKDRLTCGDAPCDSYDFFEHRYTNSAFSVAEARKSFLKFFEERGHTPIRPRPVVARWRDDIYLTIASIVLFQPFVTSGQVPPPANPLVVSQPCIRLPDIDNVGLTAGRHSTLFEMGGHHAFNYPEKEIYWKDGTVRYCLDFYSIETGLEPEKISFKESVWGPAGGNAGPCFEVSAGGLEIATLVFMEYEVNALDEWTLLPLKIVDTGYGMERLAWLSQRTPTAFHAVYGGLVRDFAKMLGVVMPEDSILREAARYSALMNLEGGKNIVELRARVASALGMRAEELSELMSPAEAAFAVLDHTRTMSFMLADGIVPSNSGEGYLARLLIRRALRLRQRLKSDVPLSELVSKQIELWGEDFPQLKEESSTVLEEVQLEESRFSQSAARSIPQVAGFLEKYRAGKISAAEGLVELYDTHGVDPYLVREEGKHRGVEVQVPDEFFGLVAAQHSSAAPKPAKPVTADQVLLAQPPTRRLYYEDSSMMEFEAHVLAARKDAVVLDRTCFYPEGGGQPADNGTIITARGNLRVKDVQSENGVIIHYIDSLIESGTLAQGDTVRGIVDRERRLQLTQSHDATHILLASARHVLGRHIWQAGAQKGLEHSRLDVTHYKKVSEHDIEKIEKLANDVVQKDIKITAELVERGKAEDAYGYSIYQGGVVPGTTLRIVKIEDFDVEACGGTHSHSTGHVGYIRINKTEQPQDGIARFLFSAGRAAVERGRAEANTLERASLELNTTPEQLVDRIIAEQKDGKRLRSSLEAITRKYVLELTKSVLPVRTPAGEVRVFLIPAEDSSLEVSQLAKSLANLGGTAAVVLKGNSLAIAAPVGGTTSIAVPASRLKSELSAKGGGGKTYAEYLVPVSSLPASIAELTTLVIRSWS